MLPFSLDIAITPECDGELELPVGLVADGDHPRVPLADPTAVILLLAHVVDDVPEQLVVAHAIVFNLDSKSPSLMKES